MGDDVVDTDAQKTRLTRMVAIRSLPFPAETRTPPATGIPPGSSDVGTLLVVTP
jgi:hypothetical protein